MPTYPVGEYITPDAQEDLDLVIAGSTAHARSKAKKD